MSLYFGRILGIFIVAFSLSACRTSTGLINQPIGLIQLGMEIEEVSDVLGEGDLVKSDATGGRFLIETRAYPSRDGRVYVIYFVDDVVRRWELVDRAPTARQSE